MLADVCCRLRGTSKHFSDHHRRSDYVFTNSPAGAARHGFLSPASKSGDFSAFGCAATHFGGINSESGWRIADQCYTHTMKQARPPTGLGLRGRELWRKVTADYTLTAAAVVEAYARADNQVRDGTNALFCSAVWSGGFSSSSKVDRGS
jgi:hypothetical protein